MRLFDDLVFEIKRKKLIKRFCTKCDVKDKCGTDEFTASKCPMVKYAIDYVSKVKEEK